MLALAFIIWIQPMDHWYDGPLFERMISIPERGWSTWRFRPVGPDADKIRRLNARLQGSPIFVLAPDSPYAGYGLQAEQNGWVALVQFNWLVHDAVRSTGGTDYEHSPGVIPARHEALAWGLAALRSMGIEPDIDWEPGFPEHSRRWETQIAHDAKEAQVYDPAVVRLALERFGGRGPARSGHGAPATASASAGGAQAQDQGRDARHLPAVWAAHPAAVCRRRGRVSDAAADRRHLVDPGGVMSAPAALSCDFGPYEGPLGDRAVSDVHPHLGTSFSIEADTPRLKAFEAWLRRHPIYVRVPGEKYLIYGMKSWPQAPGDVVVLGANLLLSPSEQPLGPWEPDGGEMLSWAFSVMDHYELGYRPEAQFHRKTRQQLIDWYHSDSVPVDWQAVAERLRATGRPVPDDLFDDHD